MKLLIYLLFLPVIFTLIQDPLKDIVIISGTGKCNMPLKYKRIKNNSTDKTVIVTISKKNIENGKDSPSTNIDTLKPGQIKDLGCFGCTTSNESNVCIYFSLTSAVYLNP